MKAHISAYSSQLIEVLQGHDWKEVEVLGETLLDAVLNDKQVFICGNGGSAGNAIHIANDFIYGIAPGKKVMRVEALPANQSVITCLGNDIGYDNIFGYQVTAKGRENDVLIVLSGSGNSPNIIKAIEAAEQLGITTFGILGYSGGKAKSLVDHAIHFAIDDMQIAEDTQLIVGHMVMKYLFSELEKHNG